MIATTASTMANYKIELLFPGETVSSGKRYQVIQTTGMTNGVRVLCARVSGTWVVIGALRG